jgi:hypothetical protein
MKDPLDYGDTGLWCPIRDKEFVGVTEDCSEHCRPAVGVIPGGGWKVRYRSKTSMTLMLNMLYLSFTGP